MKWIYFFATSLWFLLASCGQASSPLPLPVESPIIQKTDTAKPIPTASPTSPAPEPTPAPTRTTSPATTNDLPWPTPACSQETQDAYLGQVDPLFHEFLEDAKIGQQIETLDQAQIEAFQKEAAVRLEAFSQINPPVCAQEAHTKLKDCLSLAVQSWEKGLSGDMQAAKELLRSSYDEMVAAISLLAGYSDQ